MYAVLVTIPTARAFTCKSLQAALRAGCSATSSLAGHARWVSAPVSCSPLPTPEQIELVPISSARRYLIFGNIRHRSPDNDAIALRALMTLDYNQLGIGICALSANKQKDASNGRPLYAAFVLYSSFAENGAS